jgi:hypothetical protein
MKSSNNKRPASLSAKAKEFVGTSSSLSSLQLTTTTQTGPLCDTESSADLWQEPSKDGSATTSLSPFVNEFVPQTQTHQQVQQGQSPSFHDAVDARGGNCNFSFVEFVPHQNKIASSFSSLSTSATPYKYTPQHGVDIGTAAASHPPPCHFSPPPPRPPLCRFFARGGCHKGMDCPFRHDRNAALIHRSMDIDIDDESNNNNSIHSMDGNENRCLFTIQDGIRCAFQNGLRVTRIQLGSDTNSTTSTGDGSKTIAISGLTMDISNADLEARLDQFGPVTSMIITRKQPTYALVTLSEARLAEDAVKALCGSSVQSWMGTTKHANVSTADVVSLPFRRGPPTAVPPKPGRGTKNNQNYKPTSMVSVSLLQNQVVTTRGVTIKVLWYAPSRCAWVHFRTLAMAKAAAKACHGAVFSCGHQRYQQRVLTASVQAPTPGQRQSFSVWIGGLPDQVNTEELKRFVHKQSKHWVTSVALGAVPFRDNHGAAIVKRLLEKHGRLTHFEESPNQGEPLKRKALTKFSNAEEADKVCQYFGGTKHVPELGGSKLLLTRIFLAKSTVSNQVFGAIETVLIAKLSTIPDTRYNVYRNEKTTTISMNAERPESIASAKAVLRVIVTGQAVAHSQLLLSMWRSPRIIRSVELEIHRLNERNQAYGLLDRRKQEIRLFGSFEARSTLEQKVLKGIDKILGESKLSVPISDADYVFLLQGGRLLVDKLVSLSFVQSLSLDIKNRAIIVEGGSVDVKKVLANLHKLQRLPGTGGNNDGGGKLGTSPLEQQLCPVCFCPPEEDTSGTPIQLPCTHSYCNDCFREWITGTRTCQYPVECLADGCASFAPLEVLERCLTREEFQRAMREAVDDHVNKHLDSFQFCFTPGCSGICRLDPLSRLACCSTCDTTFCTACKVEEHEDLSCEQHREASLPPNRLRIKIVDEILTLRCPRCSQAFLDFEGCFALRCSSCPCGFCGWCLQDCGVDAHAHVATCPAKLGADLYFGSHELFEKAQRKRQHDALVSFLKTVARNERAEALDSIQTDLDDLGIVIDLKALSM